MCRKTLVILLVVLWAFPASADMIVDAAWVRLYNGPHNSDDAAKALAVDEYGNVYVTGQSMGSGTHWDYATIKYYPDGDTAWVRRYNGAADSSDLGLAIAADGLGNVYVIGQSWSDEGRWDYATVKYYPNGEMAWATRYSGPDDLADLPFGIAVDGSGNVYVTGYSYGSETDKDYATVKYDQDGNELWVRRYDGPVSDADAACGVAVDGLGNAYVAGTSRGNVTSDFVIIKYDPDGNELWVERYSAPENTHAKAADLSLDELGNVYVTGTRSSSGASNDYATVKYDQNGNQLWARIYDADLAYPPGDYANAIAVNGVGNAYVTGWSRTSETSFDYATVKYDPDGNELWVARYHWGSDNWESAYDVAVDGFGNAYVTGYAEAIEGGQDDYLTVKYDSEGNQLWTTRYSGSGDYFDGAWAIAVDGSDNVYVTGQASGSGTGYDYATIKYVQFDAIRGDANSDGVVESGDVVFMINYLFRDGASPDPLQAGDSNCDGTVGSGDVVYLINYLFRGGPPPSC